MSAVLDILASAPFWAAALRIASPLIFGVLGALLCERAGVLNLGIEGIFVAGALAGWMTVWLGAGLVSGVLVAALAGALLGVVLAGLTVPLGLSQHVSGLGVTLLATATAGFVYRTAVPDLASPPRIRPFPALDTGALADIPAIGPVLAPQTALTWLALLCVVLVWWLLDRTPRGLAIKAVGDNPAAVEAQGLSVTGLRVGAVVAGSVLMALGGAFLTLSAFDSFGVGMVAGRGWVCLALVIFAAWRPWRALVGALLFGAFEAGQMRLQVSMGATVPSQAFVMLPYLLLIAALVIAARRDARPRALLKPWVKGQR